MVGSTKHRRSLGEPWRSSLGLAPCGSCYRQYQAQNSSECLLGQPRILMKSDMNTTGWDQCLGLLLIFPEVFGAFYVFERISYSPYLRQRIL